VRTVLAKPRLWVVLAYWFFAAHAAFAAQGSGQRTFATPEEAVKHIKARTADVPVELFTMMLMPPGSPINSVQTSLELFAKKVMPSFQ